MKIKLISAVLSFSALTAVTCLGSESDELTGSSSGHRASGRSVIAGGDVATEHGQVAGGDALRDRAKKVGGGYAKDNGKVAGGDLDDSVKVKVAVKF